MRRFEQADALAMDRDAQALIMAPTMRRQMKRVVGQALREAGFVLDLLQGQHVGVDGLDAPDDAIEIVMARPAVPAGIVAQIPGCDPKDMLGIVSFGTWMPGRVPEGHAQHDDEGSEQTTQEGQPKTHTLEVGHDGAVVASGATRPSRRLRFASR